MNNSYFNIHQDITYPNFCQACLVGKHESQMSLDTRYCVGCYDFLTEEARNDGRWGKADWKPCSKATKVTKEPEKPFEVPLATEIRIPIHHEASWVLIPSKPNKAKGIKTLPSTPILTSAVDLEKMCLPN